MRVYVATALSGAFIPKCLHISLCLSELGCELKKRSNRVHKLLAHHTSPTFAAMLLSSLFIATPMRYKHQPSNKQLTTYALKKHFPHGTPLFTRASTNVTRVYLQRPRSWFAPMRYHISFCLSEQGCEQRNCSNRVHKRLAHHDSQSCAVAAKFFAHSHPYALQAQPFQYTADNQYACHEICT